MNHSLKSQEAPIGLIAGQGEFPLLFATAAMAVGKKVIVFGIEGQTDRRIEELNLETHYVGLGELEKLVLLLKEKKIKQVMLAGGVPKKEIYNPSFRIDATAQNLIYGTKNKGDDHLLRAFQIFLKVKCGISILDSRKFLKEAMAPKGVLTRRQPTPAEWEDLRFGWKIAKGIGRLDIGQTVVIKKGVVLAIEAIEGTDSAIGRGGLLANGGAVVVKVCKPTQNLRFDLPCVGRATLESLSSASSQVLGVEAGKTIMIFKDKLIQTANEKEISIVGL